MKREKGNEFCYLSCSKMKKITKMAYSITLFGMETVDQMAIVSETSVITKLGVWCPSFLPCIM